MATGVHVLTVGRPASLYRDAVGHYARLLAPFVPLTLGHTRTVAERGARPARAMAAEARQLRALCPENGWVVALGGEGKACDSRGFARWLECRRASGVSTVFLVGGAYGLAPELVAQADEVRSLSPLTFSHDIALVVLLEQVYRAFTILYGHPYHK